jgi:hypothetical protein
MTTLAFQNKTSKCDITVNEDPIIVGITYNDEKLVIQKVSIATEAKGKVASEEYIFKWSKNQLYVYDTLGEISLVEVMDLKNEGGDFKIASFNSKNQEIELVYIVKENLFIGLQKDYIRVFDDTGDISISKIILKDGVGFSSRYTTENGDILIVKGAKSKGNCKWNGIPIGCLNKM